MATENRINVKLDSRFITDLRTRLNFAADDNVSNSEIMLLMTLESIHDVDEAYVFLRNHADSFSQDVRRDGRRYKRIRRDVNSPWGYSTNDDVLNIEDRLNRVKARSLELDAGNGGAVMSKLGKLEEFVETNLVNLAKLESMNKDELENVLNGLRIVDKHVKALTNTVSLDSNYQQDMFATILQLLVEIKNPDIDVTADILTNVVDFGKETSSIFNAQKRASDKELYYQVKNNHKD